MSTQANIALAQVLITEARGCIAKAKRPAPSYIPDYKGYWTARAKQYLGDAALLLGYTVDLPF